MGLGKFLGGALLAVGAVVAAPVVLPAMGVAAAGAAATAGTAALGAAAAAGGAVATAGTAIAGTAAAVGTAATGAVAAAGTAIAGTAVGSAATGAMAAVGTGVASAAGAAGLTTVAAVAETTAGAAALGAITTTGAVGVAAGVSGAKKLSEANDIKESAQRRYEIEKEEFDTVQENTNHALEELGKEKLKIWESFDRFVIMYSKIQNPPVMEGNVDKESLVLTADELNNIKAVAISVKDLLSGGAGSVAAGGLIGLATSGGLVSTITVASTGTAISTLSGAAATNATLAALGGGSLAAGGAGMAGGAAVLGGLTFAPMLMVGGIALHLKANKSLESAKDIERKAESAITKMQKAQNELEKVRGLSDEILCELQQLNKKYICFIAVMEEVVVRTTNYRSFSYDEKKLLEKTILTLKLLKQVSMQNILDSNNKNAILDSEVRVVLSNSGKLRKEKLMAGNTGIYIDPAVRTGWTDFCIYLYAVGSDTSNKGWPGVHQAELTIEKNGLFSYQIPDNLQGLDCTVIFSNGGTEQVENNWIISPDEQKIWNESDSWADYSAG